jgi:uncharacterized protein
MDCAEKIATVQAFMRCINSGDYERAAGYLHHDVGVVEPTLVPYAGTYVGHTQFIAMMRSALQFWKSWRDIPYPYELACVGDTVFREHRFRAEVRSTGETVEMQFLEVAEFRSDKIARIRPYYFDPAVIDAATRKPSSDLSLSRPPQAQPIRAADRRSPVADDRRPAVEGGVNRHIETVQEYLDRLGKAGYSAALELVQPDVRLVVPSQLPYGGTWTGREQVAQLLPEIEDAWTDWSTTDRIELAGVGQRVFREVEFRATLVRTGRQESMFLTEVFEFRDGRIAEIRRYYADPVRLLGHRAQSPTGS